MSYSISSKIHPLELAVLYHELLRRMVDDDFGTPSSSASSSSQSDALKNSRRGLRAITFTSLGAEPQGGAATVHRRVAYTDDQHFLADGIDVVKSH